MASEAHPLARPAWPVDGQDTIAVRPASITRPLRPAALAGVLLGLLLLTVAPQQAPKTAPSAAAANLQAIPLAARPLVSRTLGRTQASYAIRTSAGLLVATNRAQGLEARFGANGVQVRSRSDTLALRLRSVGYGHALSPVTPTTPTRQANRVTYQRGTLSEWYVNGPLGLEQGFTLRAPPAGARTEPLTLALSLSSSLSPALDRGGKSLSFVGSSLRYAGLTAYDSRGHSLPARLDLRGQRVLIRVDDAAARYPVRVDPFVQQAKLTASDGSALGPVAISGNTIVAGAPYSDVSGDHYQGAVYVFVKPAGGWTSATQTAKLTTSDGATWDEVGYQVAISGDTIVAGAPFADVSGNVNQGAAYVFVKPATGWKDENETAKLTASDGGPHEIFGLSVAIDGDTIVAGAPESNDGAAYVFVKPPGGWTSGTDTAKLTGVDPNAYYVGVSVAVSGDTVVAGSLQADYAGAVYVFVKPTTGWVDDTQTAKLHASDNSANDNLDLGVSVAVEGDTVVAWSENHNTDVVAAYVFVKPLGGWLNKTQTAKLIASGAWGNSQVSISGDRVVIGDPFASFPDRREQGAVDVFVKPPDGWTNATQTEQLTPSDGSTADYFGGSEAISGNTIAASSRQGVYVFGWTTTLVSVTKDLAPATDPGRFDLMVGGTVVKTAAADGDFGSKGVAPGTYRVAERATGATNLSNYATSIACTINGNPGPSANGTTQLDVMVAEGDDVACTITNRRKAQITLTKHLGPASDPGRFDLKVGGTVVKAAAGDGGSGSTQVTAGTYTLSEVATAGTSLSDYVRSIACTRNGGPGPSGSGSSLDVTVAWGDVLACAFTNNRTATITLTKHVVPASDPGRFDLKVGATVVKAAAGEGGSGSAQVAPGTYTLSETPAAGTSLLDYTSSFSCTLNGNPGPSWQGASGPVDVGPLDVLACTLTNTRLATITLTKHLVPASDPGRFDLRLGSTVIRAAAGEGDSGSTQVGPGTYRVTEGALSGTNLANYSTSIACTRNGGPGPSANGTTRLDVSVAAGDQLACTLTNKRKAQITVTKHLVPVSDPGLFNLKVGGTVVKVGAGDGDSGSRLVGAGTYVVSEVAGLGTGLANYTSSIACTRNGVPGPSGGGTSLNVSATWGDVLVCTITNQRR